MVTDNRGRQEEEERRKPGEGEVKRMFMSAAMCGAGRSVGHSLVPEKERKREKVNCPSDKFKI